ncbi:EI24 domain-containing protein [Helicobacter jaachi]|uniref:EI24 domain-containing protein n=1 Tax=Helicobacter jaachi TaxID=1677920 RepID=A0A4U8TBN6_9HELI|nr:EI24 domain-containing protein [Helicobacter jaachi]TLD97350.1 EI24 domain-containing protein [Helicobacter jaachi]
MSDIFTRSLRDFFSPQILLLTLLPCLLGMLVWFVLFVTFGVAIKEWALSFVQEWSAEDSMVLSFLAPLITILAKVIIYTIFGATFFAIILLLNLLVAVFYAPIIVSFVHKRYYKDIPKGGFDNLAQSLWCFIKIAFLFLIGFILCLGLSWALPVISQVLLILLTYWFFKTTLFYDVGSSMMDRAHFLALTESARGKNHAISICAYLLSLIPFVNFFMLPLQILLLTHYCFYRIK